MKLDMYPGDMQYYCPAAAFDVIIAIEEQPE